MLLLDGLIIAFEMIECNVTVSQWPGSKFALSISILFLFMTSAGAAKSGYLSVCVFTAAAAPASETARCAHANASSSMSSSLPVDHNASNLALQSSFNGTMVTTK